MSGDRDFYCRLEIFKSLVALLFSLLACLCIRKDKQTSYVPERYRIVTT